MDIVNLIKPFLQTDNAKAIAPILNLLRENSFDLKRTLQSLTPDKLAPIIKALSERSADFSQEQSTVFERANGVAPIADIADREIVYTLNKYVSAYN